MKLGRILLKEKEKDKRQKLQLHPGVPRQNKKLNQRHAGDRTKRTMQVRINAETGSIDS